MPVGKNTFLEASLLLFVLALLAVSPVAASPGGIYDSIPSPLPGNVVSQGYECCTVSEFGDYIGFAGTDRNLIAVTVTMSDWACESGDWWSGPPCVTTPGATWSHPITLNLYNVVPGPPPTVGSLIAAKTQTFTIPYRPSEDPTHCPGGHQWYDSAAAKCYNGYAFNIIFDFTGMKVVLPDQIIFGIAYNTRTWGYAPLGVSGPYDSLNVGVRDYTTDGSPVPTGTDVETDAVFMYAHLVGPGYSSAGPVDVFRRDTNWYPYTPSVCFSVPSAVCPGVPFPAGPVGGVVTPLNASAVVAPWLAAIGLVGCISIIVVVTKKHQS